MLPSLKQCKYKNIKIHKLFSNLKETGESDLEEKFHLVEAFLTIYYPF
jgi:hypothetical protein